MQPPENATYACIGAFMDELVRSGVQHLCLCPGSRSAPLAMSAARRAGLRVWTHVDERSAGFFALGMAKGQRRAVAVLSTSGTAAANFLPAVVEARYGRVPLLVFTADRPREVRDFGASQTIDQVRLYGSHVKWFVDAAPPEGRNETLRYFRTVACRAAATAAAAPAGPVHVNVPLREPLVPTPIPHEMLSETSRAPSAWEGRPNGHRYASVAQPPRIPDPEFVQRLTDDLCRTARGLIVCGPQDNPELAGAVRGLAEALGYPILADPLSQVRCGPHDHRLVIDGYDTMLRADEIMRTLIPEVVLRVGGIPASRPLLDYLQHHADARHVIVDAEDGWTDPMHLAADIIHADARTVCEHMAARADRRRRTPGSPWTSRWIHLNTVARQAVQQALAAVNEPFEGKVFSELARLLPDHSTLYVGNSMPVRDLDAFFPAVPRAIHVLGNRGASGIDGLVSSALGVAAVRPDPVVLVLGDLSFYHDMNGLLAAKLHRLRATIVLLNNDGGGIFSFLPQASFPEHFETLFGTPTGLDFHAAAMLYGAAFARADTWPAFHREIREGLEGAGVRIVEVATRRERNVALHREVWAAAEAALREAS